MSNTHSAQSPLGGSEAPSIAEKVPTNPVVKVPTNQMTPDGPKIERPVTGFRWFLVCIGIYLSAMLYGLDTTIAADVQGPIIVAFGEIDKLSWVGVGFSLGSVATILIIGLFYGLFEIKWIYLSSIALFEIGSTICAAAPTMNALIAGRVIAGAGGAGIYLGGLNYMSIFTNIQERPLYVASIGLCWGVGCILGPVIGGAFSDSNASWRWAFYINLVLGGATAPIYIFLFPKYQPAPDSTVWTKIFKIDWIGAALVAASFTLFVVVLSYAGVAWEWSYGGTIALWVVLGAVLITLVIHQKFKPFITDADRIFPGHLLKSRTMILLYITTSCASAGLFVTIYYVPIFFQFSKNDSAIEAAVRLLPFITIMVFFMMLAGGLLPIINYYSPFYFVAGVFMLIGGSLMFTVTSTTPTANIYGFEILIAIGAGTSAQAAYSIIATKVQPHEIAAAIGYVNVSQIGSIALTLGIAGSIFQNIGFSNLQTALAGQGYSSDELRQALAGVDSVIISTAPPAVRQAAVDSIVHTISTLYSLVMAAGALSLISSLFMKHEKFIKDAPATETAVAV